MHSSRGAGGLATVIVAVVAILGTALYFVTGHSIPSFQSASPIINSIVPQGNNGNSAQPSASQESQSESIKVSNAHTWVNNETGRSVTAFAVQNTGSTVVSINSISMRGLPISNAYWFSCTSAYCGTITNIDTELKVNYDPSAGVVLGDGNNYRMTAGPISLNPGQATVVYVPSAGDISSVDAGNTYSLQIQAGQSTAVLHVQVITS